MPDRAGRPFWLRPRWLAGHVLALVLVVSFVRLGLWQLARLDQRLSTNARIEAQLEAPPTAFSDLVPLETFVSAEGVAADPSAEPELDAAAYRRARATGVYDGAATVWIRNRSFEGQPGWHLLTPLRVAPGRAVLVDRGWVPRDAPASAASAPTGTLDVAGVILPDDDPPRSGFAARFGPRDPAPDATAGRLEKAYYADASRIAADVPYALAPVVLRIVPDSTDPEAGTSSGASATTVPLTQITAPLPVALPARTRGPHLSYAVQWFTFALIGVVGYGFLMRRQAREAEDAAQSTPAESSGDAGA